MSCCITLAFLKTAEKSCFANDFEPFWKKIQNESGVKNFKLFEGVSPSF